MKVWLIAVIIWICSCSNGDENSPPKFDTKYNIKSAHSALKIAKHLSERDEITDSEWNNLFQSTGYKSYLNYSDSIYKKDFLKEAFTIVFDQNQSSKLDSILSVPIQFNQHFFKLLTVKNINDLKKNYSAAVSFLDNTDFPRLLDTADSIARQFLPIIDNTRSIYDLPDVYFIVSDPDGKVTDMAITIDLNMAVKMGFDKLAMLIAHEYHHYYRQLQTDKYEDFLMVELNKIHQEGLADLIDKEIPPISKKGIFRFYPDAFIKTYNETYIKTPQILRSLDSITVLYLRSQIDTTSFQKELKNYFKIGGHPNGYYMTLLIKEKIGIDQLIEHFDDPVAFIKLYNEAALKSERDHVFSKNFLDYFL